MTKHEPIAERVTRGAEVLDEINPSWRKDIDVARLNIASPFSCVLGQAFGLYAHGLAAVEDYLFETGSLPESTRENDVDDLVAGSHGFNLYMDEEDDDRFTFDALWAEWMRELGHDPNAFNEEN